ncbi:MAG TPA: AraC family transcriptional regulator [Gemmatimonadales bacterium]|jgi:AraC-like DNA-binding protein
MDVLSDILTTLRFRGSLYFSTEFRPPWGVRVPHFRRVARFHLVVRGACWIRVENVSDPVRLETGDIILVPRGAEHIITDMPDTPAKAVDEVVRAAGFTGRGALVIGDADSGAPTRLVCGHFEFDDDVDNPLLERLPPALVVRWDEEVRNYPLEDAFRLIVREVREGHPGHEAVVERLSEILFVQVVRTWARRANHERGVLAALADPRLGAALEAIHTEPRARWTLETLSRRAAMGRSAFVERFGTVVGESPLRYLTRWRTQVAKRLLADSGLSLDQIAGRVGYESAAAFSRVFKRTAGVSPGEYRRNVRRVA